MICRAFMAVCVALGASAALAQSGGRGPADGYTFSVTFENDVFAGTDQDYTSGLRYDLVTPRNQLPALGRFARRNLRWLTDAEDWYMTYAVGQNIFTPSDITLTQPPPGERPYAGFLYGSVGIAADSGRTLDVIALEIGLVGPGSFADEAQTFVHEIIPSAPIPRGWGTQLETEVAFRLIYERKYQFEGNLITFPFDLSVDFAPHYNFSLGTVDTSAGVGATFRIGSDLTDDYGPPRIRPAVSSPGFFRPQSLFSWYLFVGAEGRVVGRNLFIEGNTFGGVDGVNPTRFVADLQAGWAIQFGTVEFAYTHVIRTKEYEGQDRLSQFGSVNVRLKF